MAYRGDLLILNTSIIAACGSSYTIMRILCAVFSSINLINYMEAHVMFYFLKKIYIQKIGEEKVGEEITRCEIKSSPII